MARHEFPDNESENKEKKWFEKSLSLKGCGDRDSVEIDHDYVNNSLVKYTWTDERTGKIEHSEFQPKKGWILTDHHVALRRKSKGGGAWLVLKFKREE